MKNGLGRTGTFIYNQSARQLSRFLRGQRQNFYFHINPDTYEYVDYNVFHGNTVYIVSHIGRHGVEIRFTNPLYRYGDGDVYFTTRSHRLYGIQGLIGEVRDYIRKRLLFPPGRFRDLQLLYKVPKQRFVSWYKNFKTIEKCRALSEHEEMLEKYRKKNCIGFDENLNSCICIALKAKIINK
jgi:hypothetical protein